MCLSKKINIPSRIIKIALDESKKTNVKKGRVSALAIDKRFNILAKTHNVKICGHESIFSIHAEQRLLSKFRVRVQTLLIFRNIKHSIPAISKPCPKCMFHIRSAGVRTIIYFDGTTWIQERVL